MSRFARYLYNLFKEPSGAVSYESTEPVATKTILSMDSPARTKASPGWSVRQFDLRIIACVEINQ